MQWTKKIPIKCFATYCCRCCFFSSKVGSYTRAPCVAFQSDLRNFQVIFFPADLFAFYQRFWYSKARSKYCKFWNQIDYQRSTYIYGIQKETELMLVIKSQSVFFSFNVKFSNINSIEIKRDPNINSPVNAIWFLNCITSVRIEKPTV